MKKLTKKNILKRWDRFAKDNNLEFNPSENISYKAGLCAKYGGACPCLPHDRTCPEKECLEDIRKCGVCYCYVFKEKGRKIDSEAYAKMAKEVRENFKKAKALQR